MGFYFNFFKQQWRIQVKQTREFFFLIGNARKTREAYDYLREAYQQVLEYLDKDFSRSRIIVKDWQGNETATNIKDELEDLKFEHSQTSGQMIPYRRRYYLCRILYILTPQVVEMLQGYSENTAQYKEFDFIKYQKKIESIEPMMRWY